MKDFFPFWLVACIWYLGMSGQTDADPVKIAVAGDPSLANLVDVATAELARQPELTVLDRADLAKLGQEQQLQGLVDSRDFSQLQLLPADGLVLLRSATQKGSTGVFARLVAVKPGVVLREVALPDGTDPGAQAQVLAQEFASYWSKLAAIQKDTIAALSLLGLRFEVDAPETRDMERSINMLLASRLSAEPDVLVLERWRLNDAAFEKSISPQQPSPFWTGSSLIDGSMRRHDGVIDVTLRVRPPQGSEISIAESDTPDHLPALVERLADKIRNHPASPRAWDASAEAAHYSQLAQWCLDNRLFQEGAEAIESALALGDHRPATRVLQLRAYAMEAYPDDLRGFNNGDNYRLGHITADSLPARVAAATQAARLTHDYLQVNRSSFSQMPMPDDPNSLGLAALETCLRILWAAYDNGYHLNHAADVADLRHGVQLLMGDFEAKLSPPSPSRQREVFLAYRAFFAGLWHETPEATLAFYREMLQPGQPDGAMIRNEIFRAPCVREPYLDGESKPNPFPWPEWGTPWMVAWDGRSPDEVKTLWQNFLRELASSPDSTWQADALKCELSSDRILADRGAVLARFLAFLPQHFDCLSGAHADEFIAGIDSFFWETQRRENTALSVEFLNLYVTLFKEHATLAPLWIDEMIHLHYNSGASDSAQALLAALNDYSQWRQIQKPQDGSLAAALDRAHQALYRAEPELDPATKMVPEMGFLTVSRFWDMPIAEAVDPRFGTHVVQIDLYTHLSAENHIWFLTAFRPHQVVCMDPATRQVVSTYPIPEAVDPVHPPASERYRAIEVSPQWIIVALNGQVLLGSRSDNQRRALELPPSSYKPRWVNQQLYLLYNARFGDQLIAFNATGAVSAGSGLIHVSLPDGVCDNLISSRRVPPQNALDGQPLGKPLDLWQAPSGLNVAFEGRPIYAAPMGKNTWSPVTTAPTRQRLRVTPAGALIEEGFTAELFGRLSLLTDSGRKVLLSDTVGGQTPDTEKPSWNFPAELDIHHFPEEIAQSSPVLRGDDLCFYFRFKRGASGGNQDVLYYFAKGRKDGIKIPLAFDFQKTGAPVLNRLITPAAGFDSLQTTDYGLVLAQGTRGLWIIPWSDVDAYRAKVGPVTATAPAPHSAE